jgi:hypothetical protein
LSLNIKTKMDQFLNMAGGMMGGGGGGSGLSQMAGGLGSSIAIFKQFDRNGILKHPFICFFY